MMKYTMKTAALLLAFVLTASAVSFQCFAETDSNAQKEEVIYIMADAAGNVKNVYAVNIFGQGSHTDYGDYQDIKILNTKDKLQKTVSGYSFTTDSDKVYVQGTLPDAEIPWDISIRYFLDGKELSASEIAGKSGKLEIRFTVAKNEKCDSDFYEGCALQADFTLDTARCKEITAPDATLANVGANKQLTYTILPNKGIETSIFADVTDFEMPSAAINGIKLNLNMTVDTSAFSDKISELTDGIGKVDDGAKTLSDGTGTLKDGTKSLKDGSQELAKGADSLAGGISKLESGVKTVQEGLDALYRQNDSLNGGSAQVKDALDTIQSALNTVSADTESLRTLLNASGQIADGISELCSGAQSLQQGVSYTAYQNTMAQNGLDITALQNGNTAAIQVLNGQLAQLETGLQTASDDAAKTAEIQAQIEQTKNLITLLTGSSGMIQGTQAYLNGLHDGAAQIDNGLSALKESYSKFHSGLQTMTDTLAGMLVQLSSLSDGISELASQYSGLDSGIRQYTDGVAKIVSGYQSITSGTSALTSGSKDLRSGAEDLKDGVSALYDGTEDLSDGSQQLADGTGKLREKTNGIDKKIDNEIDSLLDEIKGKDLSNISFVSDKNTNVKSVQFVMKTDAVTMPAEDTAAPAQEEHLSFWQKLLRLFGIEKK